MTAPVRRALAWPCAIAAVTGVLVWNLIFDLWLGQGERQYLWERARHRLGEGAAVSLDGSMASSIRSGFWIATAWTVIVVAAVVGASYLAYRAARGSSTRDG